MLQKKWWSTILLIVFLLASVQHSGLTTEARAERGAIEVSKLQYAFGDKGMPPLYITLIEDTAMYDEAKETLNPVGTLYGQQSLTIKGGEDGWFIVQDVHDSKWLLVETWLGDKWIKPTYMIFGSILQQKRNILLTEEEELYDAPLDEKQTREYLAPQTIEYKASTSYGPFYLVSTWRGDKWISPKHRFLDGIQSTEEQLKFMQPAYIYKFPYLLTDDKTLLEAGTYAVFEMWMEWAHIRTPHGEVWVNPNFTMPAKWKQEKVEVTLDRMAVVYTQPFRSADSLGAVAPQTLTADEYGNGWYHIDSWVGTGWIYVPVQSFDVFDPADSRLRANDLRLYSFDHGTHIEGEVKWMDDGGQVSDKVKFKIVFEDENGAALGESELIEMTLGKGKPSSFTSYSKENVRDYASAKLRIIS